MNELRTNGHNMAEYDTLNMRQKSLVDAIALNDVDDLDLSYGEITAMAAEMSGEKEYTAGYVPDFRHDHEDAIEERVQVIVNERESDEEGEHITTGDPWRSYTGPAEGIDGSGTMQWLSEVNQKKTYECEDCGKTFDTYQKKGAHVSGGCPEAESAESPTQQDDFGGDDQTVEVDLTAEDLFQIVRCLPEGEAREIFSRATGADLPPANQQEET